MIGLHFPVRLPFQVDLVDCADGIVELVLGAGARDYVLVVFGGVLVHFGDMAWATSKILISLRAHQLMLTSLLPRP